MYPSIKRITLFAFSIAFFIVIYDLNKNPDALKYFEFATSDEGITNFPVNEESSYFFNTTKNFFTNTNVEGETEQTNALIEDTKKTETPSFINYFFDK